jgi:hypothetical protein
MPASGHVASWGEWPSRRTKAKRGHRCVRRGFSGASHESVDASPPAARTVLECVAANRAAARCPEVSSDWFFEDTVAESRDSWPSLQQCRRPTESGGRDPSSASCSADFELRFQNRQRTKIFKGCNPRQRRDRDPEASGAPPKYYAPVSSHYPATTLQYPGSTPSESGGGGRNR